MSRISKIILKARDVISDASGRRWTDEQLLRKLDEGQKELVLKAELLRKKVGIPLLIGIADYEVPEDCYKITRILIEGREVPLESHESMDDFARRNVVVTDQFGTWEGYADSPVLRVIIDKLNFDMIKVYPIPTGVEGGYQTVNSDGDLLTVPYGITVGATGYTIDSPYGICGSFSADYENMYQNVDTDVDPKYGICTIFDDDSDNMTLYYLKLPDEIIFPTGITDLELVPNPEVSKVWDTALKHYVAGMALRDDKDTQNRSLGNDELQFFYDYVADALEDSAQDFKATRTQYRTPYDNGLNV